jgi:hypothetical protein
VDGVSYATAYPLVRSGGLFLMIVGAAIVLGWLRFPLRNRLLAIGAPIATIATALTAVRLTAPWGAPTAAQVIWLVAAVAIEIALLAVAIRRFAPRGERAVVLAVLIVVGAHLLPMAPAFGPLIAAVGALCAANALLAMRLPDYSLRAVWAVDGVLKGAGGLLMWWAPAL